MIFYIIWISFSLMNLSTSSLEERRKCIHAHPICGTDGVTYINKCEFEIAKQQYAYLEMDHHGQCHCTPEEKYDWDPICGTDSRSYANYCEFQKAKSYNPYLRLRHRDLCESFLKGDPLSSTVYFSLMKWKKFMPRDLFDELMKPHTEKPDTVSELKHIKGKNKRRKKHGKKINNPSLKVHHKTMN